MARKKKEANRVDEMLDELSADCQTPEDILGESGLLKQLSKRLIARALAGELNHHLQAKQDIELDERTSESVPRSNSRNGYSKKTIQSDHGEMDLAIPLVQDKTLKGLGMSETMRGELLAIVATANTTNRLANGYQVPVDEQFKV